MEILRQLRQIIHSQDDILHTVRAVAAGQTQCVAPHLSPTNGHVRRLAEDLSWDANGGVQQQTPYVSNDWFAGQQSESASTTPAAGVAAVRWFGLLATDASREAFPEADVSLGVEGALGFLCPEGGLDDNDMTALQRATRIIDGQIVPAHDVGGEVIPANIMTPANPRTEQAEEGMWQAPENICLLGREQVLFENFLNKICSWVCSNLILLLGEESLTAAASLIYSTRGALSQPGYRTSPSGTRAS